MDCPNCRQKDISFIGENTAGYIYWCDGCGTKVDEDGTKEIPFRSSNILPKCHSCKDNSDVNYIGPGSHGSDFYCTKCKTGWTQEI